MVRGHSVEEQGAWSQGLGAPERRALWHVPQAPVVGARASQAEKVAHSLSCPEVCLQAGLRSPHPLLSVHLAPRHPPVP